MSWSRRKYGTGADRCGGFYIPLAPRWQSKSFRTATRFPMPTTHEQSDFAHGKFLVFCSLQPTKSACSAAAEKCLSGVGQPLSSVSGRKRYNTLDFPKENRVPTGMLLAPIGNPEPRDASRLPARSVLQNALHFEVSTGDPHPSGHPHIFLENGTQTVKMQFDTFPQKI